MGRKIVDGATGKTGRVFIDANEICVESWDLTLTAQEEEVTNSCSAGFTEWEYGSVTGEGSISAQWDYSANPFDDPPEIRPGTSYAFKLYIHATNGVGLEDGPFWSFNAFANAIKTGVTAKQKVMYSFSYKTDGAITYPTGSGGSAS